MGNMESAEDKSMDQSLNIGSTIRLAEGLEKKVRIGTIGVLHKARDIMSEHIWKFAFVVGRKSAVVDMPKSDGDGFEKKEVDFPAMEALYRKFFDVVLEGGLTDEEYFLVDPAGIEELDKLPARFL